MPRSLKRYTVEYHGQPADGPGSPGGVGCRIKKGTATTCTRRIEQEAFTEAQALYRAMARTGGSNPRIIGRSL
jgi:hypothetical protein